MRGERSRGVSRQSAEDGGVPDRLGRDVKCSKLARELVGVFDIREQVNDRDELAVLKPGADEACVTVASLLAIGHDVHAGLELCFDDPGDSAVSQRREFRLRQTPFESIVERSQEPVGPGPATDTHHRERRDCGHGACLPSGAGFG